MRLAVSSAAGGESLAYVQTLTGGLELTAATPPRPSGAYRAALAARPRLRAGARRTRTGRRRPRRPRRGDRRLPRGGRAPTAARVRDRARRGRARRRPRRGGGAATWPWSRSRRGCCRTRASTSTSSWRCSRPTTAIRPARSSSPARPGGRRRGCARPTRSPGPCAAPARAAPRSPPPARRCASGRADPTFLYHAGVIAADAGRTRLARRYLTEVVERTPAFSPFHGPRAQAALEGLG